MTLTLAASISEFHVGDMLIQLLFFAIPILLIILVVFVLLNAKKRKDRLDRLEEKMDELQAKIDD
ncbi:hypothetical protein [Paucisalibacillus globulus]|uniref:hypothetical protein n=1 Tax=Paucisalibacillus globulus TaxID=351095 RepID=UPI000BB871FD|nr:hypothetical protein [Paucisalibacillus globulus]